MMAGAESKGWLGQGVERLRTNEVVLFARRAFERLQHPELENVVAYVDTRPRMSDVKTFTKWYQDRESARHFVPAFTTPHEIEDYYLHSPEKMHFIARNKYGDPIGVSTLLRKNPYLRGSNKKTAYTEKTLTDPSKRRQGIGLTLRTTMNDYIFRKDENGKPQFDQAQLYVMTDKDSGDYRININLFMDEMGYVIDQKNPQWREYAHEVWGLEGERQALLLVITDGMWERAKARNPKLRGAELRGVA